MNQELLVQVLDWTGAMIGLTGAFLLATHSRISRYGWLAFLVANAFTATLAWLIGRNGLLVQQIGFSITSTLGLYRAGFLDGFMFWLSRHPRLRYLRKTID